jgi:HAD superfamily hydrolase (TIGR01509 family)
MSSADVDSDTKNTLLKIKELGIKIAIGSSSKNTKFILSQLGIISLFDAISDGTNITKSKPDPEVFLKAAEMLNLPPCTCLVMEDAIAGIDAASNGGFDSIGILDASKYEKTTYPVAHFKDILSLLM